MLFGCLGGDPRETSTVLASMGAALRASAEEQSAVWQFGAFGIGVLERPLAPGEQLCEPSRGADGSLLWMSGEAFDWPSHGGLRRSTESRTAAFRARLLETILAHGPAAVRDLDGEYQIALWNPSTRTVLLINDRFAALPMYTSTTPDGVCAFAGGVRGVLMVPGVSADPDLDAIREAVTFGGYRLGARTNIRAIRMVPPASVVALSHDAITTTRYWSWSELADGDATDERALMEEMRATWKEAVAKRVDGAQRPGLMLSGGLDSRAILAEVTRQKVATTALTYGVPHSDDVSIARRAAKAAGARWELFPLYADGWLERRTNRIHETDGLMDLVDLMHTEVFDTMPSAFDVYLSGFIGDVVAGSTWFFRDRADEFLGTMPYYGGELAIPHDQALSMADALMRATPGPCRFAAYEHKSPQSTSRITAAARPFATVRRPFVDYPFFETCQRVPPHWRMQHHWRASWLRSTYPELFASIPNQQSGVPPGASETRRQLTRVARFGWRRLLGAARSAGLPVSVTERTYHPDERFWSCPSERHSIEQTILRRDSISCEVFGRVRVQDVIQHFFDNHAAPVQVVGALYVFEYYHQTLAAFVADARRQVGLQAC